MEQKPNTHPNGRRKNKIRNFDTTVDLLFSEIKALKRRQDQLDQAIQIVMQENEDEKAKRVQLHMPIVRKL